MRNVECPWRGPLSVDGFEIIPVETRVDVEGCASGSVKQGVPHVRPPAAILDRMTPDDFMAVVALGSNLGDSKRIIRLAMDRLETSSTMPLLRSSLWRSTPVECPPGSPDFINAVIGMNPHPAETPETLLARLLAMESELGRVPKQVMNEPRPLDLDLISFGRETRETPALVLPHPRAHLRRFVLQPLAEIAPHWCLPGQCKTVASLLEELGESEPLERIR